MPWFSRTIARLTGVCALAAGAALAAAPAALAAPPGVWTSNGPYGGTVTGMAASPASPATLYAATRAGVFKSADSGADWVPAVDGLGDLAVNAIAVDPADPSVVYAATQSQLYRSDDAAATWSAVPVVINGASQADFTSVAFGAGASPKVYATDVNGLAVSADGATWSWLPTPGGQPNLVVPDPSNALNLFVATAGGLERSGDGGATWSPTSLGSKGVSAVAVDPADSSIVYAADGSLERSTNGGATFTPAAGITGQVWRVAVAPSDPTHVYVAGRMAGSLTYMARSVDSGATWTQSASTAGFDVLPNLLVAPDLATRLYAGTELGVDVSTSGGATWAPSSNGMSAATPEAVAVNPANTNVVYAAMGVQGLYRSADGGNSWTSVTAGLGDALNPAAEVFVGSVAVTGDGTVYAVRTVIGPNPQPMTVLKSTNDGGTWAAANTGLPADGIQAVIAEPRAVSTLFATVGGSGAIASAVYTSVDGGGHWSPIGPAATTIAAFAVSPTGSSLVASVGGVYDSSPPQALFGSANWGASWTPDVTPPWQVDAFAFGQTAATVWAASATQSQVAVSTNGGGKWTNHAVDPTNRSSQVDVVAPDPLNPQLVYAGTDAGGLWYSTDGGGTWSQWTPGVMGGRVASLTFAAPQGGAASGNDPLYAAVAGGSISGVWRVVAAPANTALPTLTGTARSGKKLTCKPGSWARAQSFAYQWLLNGTAIKNATATTYKIPASAKNKKLSCRVTATGGGGAAVATTAAKTISK